MKKRSIRKQYLSKRSELSQKEVTESSYSIGKIIVGNFDFERIAYLHHFIPIADQNEIDTELILQPILSNNIAIKRVIPRVNNKSRQLEHLVLTAESELVVSEWGIPEPVGDELIPESLIDFVIVPLLCFDMSGHRVGYGGGYYDRFLAKCRSDCLKVGLSIFEPIDKIEGINEADVRLDYCVTPKQLYEFGDDKDVR